MGVTDRLRRVLGRPPRIRVHVLLRGRIGAAWYDEDRVMSLPEGSTLADLLQHAESRGMPLAEALAHSPHMAHTLMLNGERCPVEDNRTRVLADGDELYLLAPLAGG